jgi:hypothetical protein
VGLRYAAFESQTAFDVYGIPDWNIPAGWKSAYYPPRALNPVTFHEYEATVDTDREFKGAGPTLSWDAARELLGNDDRGHLALDWSIQAGVLFGKQKTSVTGVEQSGYFRGAYFTSSGGSPALRTPVPDEPVVLDHHRTKSVTAPVVDLSLGLSYDVGRVSVGTGYRWERYFNVLDGGYAEHKDYDRTIDGPYFKLAVGFGG